MDIATVIGIISGFSLIFISLALGSTGVVGFINLPGLLVVFGGTIASTLIMFPLKSVLGTLKIAMKVFTVKLDSPDMVIKKIIQLATKVRKNNILALEKEHLDDKFFAKGIRLCVDGSTPANIKVILNTELSYLKERHLLGQDVFEQMGTLAPAFGMIGTLIGLVQMLQTLSDPGSIGPSMAVALLTTFYGAVLANLVCLPIAKKLELRSKEESLMKELIIEGVVSISRQDNPLTLSDKLEGYLSPHERKTVKNR